MNYASHLNPKNTPQSQPLMGESQIKNNAGGFVYAVGGMQQLDRFLILGTLGGSYYSSERKLTLESAKNLIDLVKSDGPAVVNRIVEVSHGGLAAKNAPAIFALALAVRFGDTETRRAAMTSLPMVARTSTDMFSFVNQYKNELGGGMGSIVKAGLKNWYLSKKPDSLAYQMVKYRQRDGWTHHDVLHLAHPKASDEVTNRLFGFAKAVSTGKSKDFNAIGLPSIVEGYQMAMSATKASTIVDLITEHNLPREAIPTEFLNDGKVWEAMLPHMPATALLRNLGKMSSIGMISPLSDTEKLIVSKMGDKEWLRKSRIHPISVLVASLVYAGGQGARGNLTWNPSRKVLDVLDDAFYATFANVEPTGKNFLVGVDVSGSMDWGRVAGFEGIPGFNARVVAAAMSLVIAATEEHSHLMGFTGQLVDLGISPKMRLDDVVRKMSSLPFGNTDASLPMRYATANKIPVDAFVVITDNETWGSAMHPSVALREYRNVMGRDAKSIVMATEATNFTIADPKDPGMLDIVGFSTEAPAVVSNFARL